MLALDMGVGKSKVAVDLVVNREHKLTLILCPLSVVSVWPKQFALHAGMPVRVCALDRGTVRQKADRAAAFVNACRSDGHAGAVVLNYDAAWRAPFAGWSGTVPWDCLILDESHRLKSPAGKASMFCWRLSQHVSYRMALTGTPMPHSPLDVYAQYRALDPSIFGLNYHAFKQRYAVLGGYEGKQVIGFQNVEELNSKVYRIAFRVGREVLDLPEAVHQTRLCQLGPKAMRIYRQIESAFAAEVEAGSVTASNALVKLLRLQQVTSGYVRTDDGADTFLDEAKVAALADVLDDLPSDEPTVVFCRFRHDLEQVRRTAAALGRTCRELSGAQNDLAQWQAESGGSVLAVQIQSGGVGIDLTRARYAIYYSLGFSLGDYLQSLARLHRPGQTRSVVYVHLLAENTIDEQVMRRLELRQEVVEGILQLIKERRHAG